MSALYIHIPFCKSKCAYCNFFSVAGKRDLSGFAEALMSEMELRKDYLGASEIATIYFGGGTPSLMTTEDISKIIRKAKELFNTAGLMEITLEANPEHINPETIQKLYEAGVNRISIGVQSLNDTILTWLGRSHNAQCALDAIDCLRNGPVSEISVDLIFGVPGLTNDMLMQELEYMISNNIPHISTYALTVEDKTPLKHFIDKGKCAAPDEEQAAGQYLIIMERLQAAGYEHYEISNFCLPGHPSHHNSSYWDGTHYLGIGPSAHSYDGVSRQWNVAGVDAYLQGLHSGNLSFEKEVLTETQHFNEYVMTAIRTSAGINLTLIENCFGKPSADAVRKGLEPMITKGWILSDGQQVHLTNAGKLFADRIASELFR